MGERPAVRRHSAWSVGARADDGDAPEMDDASQVQEGGGAVECCAGALRCNPPNSARCQLFVVHASLHLRFPPVSLRDLVCLCMCGCTLFPSQSGNPDAGPPRLPTPAPFEVAKAVLHPRRVVVSAPTQTDVFLSRCRK